MTSLEVSRHFTINVIHDGENSVRIDLSNEADMIACDADGKVLYQRSITTVVKLYDGASPVTSGISITASSIKLAGITPTVTAVDSTGSITVSWSFPASTALSSASYSVNIPITYGGVTYTAMFTLTKTQSEAIYQVLPSKSAISFAVNASNEYTPETNYIVCGYTKYTGSGTETVESYASVIDSKYRIWYRYIKPDGTPHTSVDIVNAEGWLVYGRTVENPLPISRDIAYIAVEFAIMAYTSSATSSRPSSTDIVDKESVPIVKSGKKGDQGAQGAQGPTGPTGPQGESAVIYELVSEPTQLKTNASRTNVSTAVVKAYKTVGSSTSQYTSGTITATPYDINGTALSALTGSTSVTISTKAQVGPSSYADVDKWEIGLVISNVVVARLTVDVITSGPTLRGPRVFVPKDNYSYKSGANGEGFLDLVIYNDLYYQCIKSYVEQTGDTHTPGSSPTYWLQATGFDFVATKVLFAQRAKIENLYVDDLEMRKDSKYTKISEGNFEIGTYTEDQGTYTDSVSYRVNIKRVLKNNVWKNYAVLEFLEDGEVIGQIDSSLFGNIKNISDTWDSDNFYRYSSSTSSTRPADPSWATIFNQVGTQYFQYSEGYVQNGSTITYNDSGTSTHSQKNQKWFDRMDKDNVASQTCMPNGWYVRCTVKSYIVTNDGVSYRQYYMEVYRSVIQSSGSTYYGSELTARGIILGPMEPVQVTPV